MTPALRRGLLGALVVAGLVAGGCSGKGGSASPSGSSSSASGRSSPSAGAGSGGTMRLALGGAIVVDPVQASPAVPEDQMVLDLLHDGLTRVDAHGTVQPALALTWTPDAALKVWRFALDPAATFSDGHPITATDVVGSLTHVMAAGDTSLAALRLEPVTGFRAFVDGSAPTVTGLRAIDDHTVEIGLDTPLSVLPEIVAAPAYGVLDLTSVARAANGDLTGLDLSGAWKVGSWTTGRLVLQRRAGSPGHLDEVEVRAYPDAATAYAQLRKGAVDWAPVPTEQLGEATRVYGADHLVPFQAELALGLRVSSLPDLVLRQAIAAAIDRSAIVKAVYPDLATALPTVVPAGVTGHDPDRCATCTYDPARAKALLAQSYPAGSVPVVALDYDASPAQQALARLVARDLLAVGIPTTLRPKPLADYQHFLVTGGQEVFTLSWIAGDRSPDAYLDPLFLSTSPDNLVGLHAPDVDTLLNLARATPDPAIAATAWAQAEGLVLDQAVIVPIAQFRSQVAVAKRVSGFAQAVDGTVGWAAVSVRGGA